MDSKKWYESKAIWTGIVTFLIASYETFGQVVAPQFGFVVPSIPPYVFAILGAFGVYSRASATTKIG